MKTTFIISLSILLSLTLSVSAKELNFNDLNDDNKEIFTSKDKTFLQLGHYDEVLKMNLSEEATDEYFSRLYQYTFQMSRLGSDKFSYTSSERKNEFDKLVYKLEADMKNNLSPNNYKIHQKWFAQIENLIYEKRAWEE